MAQKNYKVNEAIEVVYQAAGAKTGLTINMEVFDETHTIVAGGPTVLTEFGATGRYYGSFTPDAVGDWTAQVEETGGKGKVVKHYSVGSYNLEDVGAITDSIHTDMSAVIVDIAAVDSALVNIDSAVTGVDGKTSDIISQLSVIESKVDEFDSPPMIG